MGFLDQVHTMPLTHHIMLALLPDEVLKKELICTLASLRRSIQNLEQWYYHLLVSGSSVGVRNPVLSLPAPWPLWMSHGHIQYASR